MKFFLILLFFLSNYVISEEVEVKALICKSSDMKSYTKYNLYLFKDRAEHYAFNQKRKEIYLHKYSEYDYKTDNGFIILGNNFFKLNRSSSELSVFNGEHIGMCEEFRSIKEGIKKMNIYLDKEQDKINKNIS